MTHVGERDAADGEVAPERQHGVRPRVAGSGRAEEGPVTHEEVDPPEEFAARGGEFPHVGQVGDPSDAPRHRDVEERGGGRQGRAVPGLEALEDHTPGQEPGAVRPLPEPDLGGRPVDEVREDLPDPRLVGRGRVDEERRLPVPPQVDQVVESEAVVGVGVGDEDPVHPGIEPLPLELVGHVRAGVHEHDLGGRREEEAAPQPPEPGVRAGLLALGAGAARPGDRPRAGGAEEEESSHAHVVLGPAKVPG